MDQGDQPSEPTPQPPHHQQTQHPYAQQYPHQTQQPYTRQYPRTEDAYAGGGWGSWAGSGWTGSDYRGGGWNRWRSTEFSVDRRMWSDKYALLDYEAQPQGYRLWKSKARAFLTGKRPQVGEVLGWAERQVDPITEARQHEAAQLIDGFDITTVSMVLDTAIRETISDQLRMTKPDLAGDGLGLEL